MFFEEGVLVNPKKIEIVVWWSMPKDKTQVRCFLELATYMQKYRIFFAKITAPMTDLLIGKFERITWTSDRHASFEALENALMKAPVSILVI